MAEFNPDFMRLLQRQLLGDGMSSFTPRPAAVDKVGTLINALDEGQEEDEIGAMLRAMELGEKQFKTTSTADEFCATCKKQYSVAFQIKDTNDKPCGAGMYYTVKFKLSGEVRRRETDANGRTERFYSTKSEETIYLYIGHRTDEDGYPDEQSGEENTLDEAFLAVHKVVEGYKNKVHPAQTQRRWKPWQISAQGDKFTSSREGLRRNAYDKDGAPGGNVTIGIGELIHEGPFVMNQKLVDQTVQYLRDQGHPVTIDNIVGAVGAATGLQGKALKNAIAEMRYVNGTTDQAAIDLFKKTKYPEHRRNIKKVIHVPLYQREFDALADVTYNRGPHILDKSGLKKDGTEWNPGGHYAEWLNRGRYFYTGDNRIRNLARTHVPGRRDDQADMFLNGEYAERTMDARDYQLQNPTPWTHVKLD